MNIYVHGLPKSKRHDYTTSRTVEHHQEKEFVVVIANTVGNPRTVMVHSSNAGVTETAVMCSVWLALHTAFTGTRLAIFILFVRDYHGIIFVFDAFS